MRGNSGRDGEGDAWSGGMIKQVCRDWVVAKSRTRVSEMNSSS